MSGKASIVGSGSSMPTKMYLQKMEQTCLFEDPDQINKYYRSTLKDIRPDAPMFESDQPRYDNYSSDRLNLRHAGARTTTDPYLPDGTFLDFQALEKDPRGSALEPDMMKHRRQQEARGKFVKFYDDADYSVPGEGRNQAKVMKDTRGQFYNMKRRMRIFDESMDSPRNSARIQHSVQIRPDECMVNADIRTPEIADALNCNKINVINDLSNNTSIGWRRTTDHKFQIARYGILNKMASINDQNIIKNRSNAHIAHDVMVSWNDQTVSKSLGITMIDLAKKKSNTLKLADKSVLSRSQSTQTRHKKLTPADFAGINSKQSQEATANALLKQDQVSHFSGRMIAPRTDSNKMAKTIVNPDIVSFMTSNNRNMTTEQTDDLREQVAQSTEFNSLLVSQHNTKPGSSQIKNDMLWESFANFDKGTSMKVANYGQLLHKRGAKSQDDVDFEEYKTEQAISGQRRGNIQNPDQYIMDATLYDNDPGMEAVGTKLVGSMGSKYVRDKIDKGDIEYNLNSEITAMNR